MLSNRFSVGHDSLEPISKTAVTPDLPRILFSGMLVSRVQNALSGFPACPKHSFGAAGRPLKTGLHAKVRRFGTQACGNDNYSLECVFEMVSNQ
jgi:hypothetical protein